jgi:threonine dehydratase
VTNVPRVVRATLPVRHDLLPTTDVLASAQRAVAAANVATTLARAPALDTYAGPKARVWLALECLQITGSFKVRGALAALAQESASHVIAASAGNHGAGVAFAAKQRGVAATVVVPTTAARKKVDAIRGHGATVIEHGDGYDAAEAFALALANERNEPFISAFDDVDVVAGNGGTLGADIAHALRAKGAVPDVVLAPFGGGGLATGIAWGLRHILGDATRRVWGVQGERSPAFAMSLERGSAVTSMPPAETVAEGLEGAIPERAFARAAGVVAGAIVVTEPSIEDAMRFCLKELGLVVEGSGAASVAALSTGLPSELALGGEPRDLVLVLTGRNVDRERLGRLV